jgi:hypothetical protein
MNNQPDRDESAGTPRNQAGAALAVAVGTSLALLACLGIAPAAAQGIGAAAKTDHWDFTVSPYFWAAGIGGTTATLPGLPPADVDMSFRDIVDDLKPTGMVFFNANKGRLGLAADVQYVETEADSKALVPLFSGETLRSTSFVLSGMVNYLVLDDGRASLRLGAGARLWSVETDLKLSDGLLPGRRITSDETWVDPIIGAGGVLDLGPRVFARGWAYVGGFGIASDITADLFVGLGYRFTDSISSTLGYRWVKVDYDRNDFLYDVRQEGIATGVAFAF